jgi:hypothetical protein
MDGFQESGYIRFNVAVDGGVVNGDGDFYCENPCCALYDSHMDYKLYNYMLSVVNLVLKHERNVPVKPTENQRQDIQSLDSAPIDEDIWMSTVGTECIMSDIHRFVTDRVYVENADWKLGEPLDIVVYANDLIYTKFRVMFTVQFTFSKIPTKKE